MNIDSEFLVQTVILAIGGGAVSMIVWGIKRAVLDKIDAMSAKIDGISETINDVSVKNAQDHGKVTERLAKIETTLGGFPAPWKR